MSTSTSTSTSTRQPTNEIDLQRSQTTINKARQLPLRVVAFKDVFIEATQDIARIAKNANPEDPNLLNVEISAIKGASIYPSGLFQVSVFESLRWGCVVRVQVPMNCVERSYGALPGLFYARWWGIRVRVTTESHYDKRRVPRDWDATSRQKRKQGSHELAAVGKATHRVISRVICIGRPPEDTQFFIFRRAPTTLSQSTQLLACRFCLSPTSIGFSIESD